MQIQFKLKNETPGALRYEEVDKDGKVLTNADGAKIGTLYIRKSAYAATGKYPSELTITIK